MGFTSRKPAARWRVALVASLLIGALQFAVVDAAYAHANLVASDPAANAVLDASPRLLRLWFSEAPEPRFSSVQLLDRSGRQLEAIGAWRADPTNATLLAAPLQSLTPGVYTVAWRVVSSVDGHATSGFFAFAVGRGQALSEAARPGTPGISAGEGGPTTPRVVIRWLGYMAMAVVTGGLAFFVFVLRPAVAGAAIRRAPDQESATAPEPLPADAGPAPPVPLLSAVLLAAWGLSVIATLGEAVMQAATSAGVPLSLALIEPLSALLGGTRYGSIFWVRLLLLGVLGVMLILGRQDLKRKGPLPGWGWAPELGASALVLLTTSLSSHAAANIYPTLSTATDWLHLGAASIWVGGLVMLSLTLACLGKMEKAGRSLLLSPLITHFSRMASLCVPALLATGVYRAITEVDGWESLFDTPYGTALLIKLALILPLLGLGGVNLLIIKPRLAPISLGRVPGPAILPWFHRIRKTAGAEVLFASAVLVVTSILIGLPPARAAFGSGAVVRGQAADLRLMLVIDPGEPGTNSFDIYVRDTVFRPVPGAEKVALYFTLVGRDMGENEAIAENLGDGRYRATAAYASVAGLWRIEVLVRRSGQEDVRVPITVRLSTHGH